MKHNTQSIDNAPASSKKSEAQDYEISEVYKQITALAIHLTGAASATINVIEANESWTKSHTLGFKRNPLDKTIFCDHSIQQTNMLEVEDARNDERFCQDARVLSGEIIYYLGFPLMEREEIVGTFYLADGQPRRLSEEQKKSLKILMAQLVEAFKIWRIKLGYEKKIEASKEMIYELDGNGKFSFSNTATTARLGYSNKELQKMYWWELVIPESREDAQSYYFDYIHNGSGSHYHEFQILTRSGKRIWLGQKLDLECRKEQTCKTLVVATDISELVEMRLRLKEMEEQVLAEKNLLKTMIFCSPSAIAMFNKDLKYMAFSEKWNEKKHLNEHVIGLNSEQKFRGQTQLISSIKERVLLGDTVGNETDLIISHEGEERWIEWVATPWNNTTDGSIGGIIVYTNDVTHMVNHEAELEKAREEALRSSKIKEDFLSSMSHEIRTPLNAIIGTTNLLMEERPDLAENSHLKLLKFSSNNLLGLINNVLDFSKIRSGKISLEEKDFELYTLIKSLVDTWAPMASQKNLELELEYDSSLPAVVKGDAVRISQVLNNLMNNALKFTEEGCVITSVEKVDVGNNKIRFQVKDTGLGIPEENQKEVFESFKQVATHLTHQHSGTGLGLPICKKLVTMMGGKLTLSSKPGFGSTFCFTIELARGNPESLKNADNKGAIRLDGINILLVEDNEANQFIARSFLNKWGATLSIAYNGKEALKKVRDKSYDMIFLDIRMPIMDGYECAEKIRHLDGDYFKVVPIIAMTASSMMDVRDQSAVRYFDDYLGKPFDPIKLHSLVLKYCGKMKEVNAAPSIGRDLPTQENRMELEDFILENLKVYTQGDPEFTITFAQNILSNLEEIKSETPLLQECKDVNGLGELIHKVKPSIEIMKQGEILRELRVIQDEWEHGVFEINYKKLHFIIGRVEHTLNKIIKAANQQLTT